MDRRQSKTFILSTNVDQNRSKQFSIAICLPKRELFALFLLFFGCLVAVNVMRLFRAVLWMGLQFAVVVFPYQTHLLFDYGKSYHLNRCSYLPHLWLARSQF